MNFFVSFNKGFHSACVNMWDTDLTNPNVVLCPGNLNKSLI